jgi:hypothetical protein
VKERRKREEEGEEGEEGERRETYSRVFFSSCFLSSATKNKRK